MRVRTNVFSRESKVSLNIPIASGFSAIASLASIFSFTATFTAFLASLRAIFSGTRKAASMPASNANSLI